MRFGDHGKRQVLATFDGGDITSDAGAVLLRETADRLDLFPRMAACFEDRRAQDQVTHTLASLLAQRVTGIALGYEDLTDHGPCRALVASTYRRSQRFFQPVRLGDDWAVPLIVALVGPR